MAFVVAAFACSETNMEGRVGHGSQALAGNVRGADWHFVTGLASDEGEWTIGLYPELSDPGFSPTQSYVELQVPGPGEYGVGDMGLVAKFMLCPPETPPGGCVGVARTQSPATSGEVDVSPIEVDGALRVEGGALLMDDLGNQVDGVFTGVPLYDPVCSRGERRCESSGVTRCSWDERVWQPEATCDGEQVCSSAVEQCAAQPASCLVELGCTALL